MKSTLKTVIHFFRDYKVGVVCLVGSFALWGLLHHHFEFVDLKQEQSNTVLIPENYVNSQEITQLPTKEIKYIGVKVPAKKIDSILVADREHSWQKVILDGVFELFILGLLVFIWEVALHHGMQKTTQRNQNLALEVLAYFLVGSSEAKKDENVYSPVFKDTIKNINHLYELDGDYKDLTFGPVKGEFLFYNLGTVLSGYQDLMVDSTGRSPEDQDAYVEIYKVLRTIEFLNDRFGYINGRTTTLDQFQKEIVFRSSLVLEIIFYLDDLNKKVSAFVKKELSIEKDVVCRLWNAVDASLVQIEKEKEQSEKNVRKVELRLLVGEGIVSSLTGKTSLALVSNPVFRRHLKKLNIEKNEKEFVTSLKNPLMQELALKYLFLTKEPGIVLNKKHLQQEIKRNKAA